VYKKMKKEELSKIGPQTWENLLQIVPLSARYLRIDKIRNQTELRRLISKRPILMKYATLEQMQSSAIAPHTWARLAADIPEKFRVHFPVGAKAWIEKNIFVGTLKGKTFKNFKEWSTNMK